jgi:hypothetical protein
MKQMFDSDSGAAIKNACCRTGVYGCSCNDQAVCIGGGADISGFGALQIYRAIMAQGIIACIKRHGFDNFTGYSLSHLITPMINIVADSWSEIKENLTDLSRELRPLYYLGGTIYGRMILWDRMEISDRKLSNPQIEYFAKFMQEKYDADYRQMSGMLQCLAARQQRSRQTNKVP